MQPASQKSYPIYDQNLQIFSITWQAIEFPIYDRHSCPKRHVCDGLLLMVLSIKMEK